MPVVNALVECPVYDSFRVRQLAGMFDVSLEAKARKQFSVEVPNAEEDWSIGCIVGPSGSGKSTIARQAFGDCLYGTKKWPANKAVVDAFGESGVRQITQMLSAVGFSSPPSWVKPYSVLSNGEKFRCDLARAILSGGSLVVFDEFTSVVDRTVAKIGSAAIAKTVRREEGRKFVAVTCHYDVAEWLEADWVLDMGTGTLTWGRLRRPAIELEVVRVRNAAWRVFAPHHYLNANLNRAAKCYLAHWNGEPVAFVGVLNSWGYVGYQRISRLVVLPDYQGVGIARAVLRTVAEVLLEDGAKQVSITTGHPSMIASLRASKEWNYLGMLKSGSVQAGGYSLVDEKRVNVRLKRSTHSAGRCIVRFKFRPDSNRSRTAQAGPAPETDRPAWLKKAPKRSRRRRPENVLASNHSVVAGDDSR